VRWSTPGERSSEEQYSPLLSILALRFAERASCSSKAAKFMDARGKCIQEHHRTGSRRGKIIAL
jgi:hypothetical protein